MARTVARGEIDRRPNRIRALVGRWESILVLIFIAVIVFNSIASPYFLNPTNLLDTTFSFVEKGLIALPMTLGIIMGDIDISVAGIIALASLVMGALSSAGMGSGTTVGRDPSSSRRWAIRSRCAPAPSWTATATQCRTARL